MARKKHVAKHLSQLDKHHKKVKKQLWAMYKKMLRHKKCWKPVKKKGRKKKGGVLVAGLGIQEKKKKAGKLVSGMGLRVPGHMKFKASARGRALLAKKDPPKTFPTPPAGLHKEAAGFGSFLKGAASSLSKTYNKHKDTINKIGSAIGNTALQLGTQYISGKIEEGKQKAQAQLERFQNTTQQMMQKAQNQYQNAMAYGQNMYNQGMGMAQGMAQNYVNQGVGMAQGMMDRGVGMAAQYGQMAQNRMQAAARGY